VGAWEKGEIVEQVLVLAPKENARLDPDRLAALYSQLGPSAAEEVVCRAMEELAMRLSHIDTLFRQQSWEGMRKNTRALIAIAEQIGMTGLARAGTHVVYCIDDADHTALAATLSRLARLGDQSLTAIWDLQDLSI
jgi:glutathione S-transferase